MARPKKPDFEQHINRIAVYLTDADDQLIRNLAARKGIAPGVLARALLKDKLDAVSKTMLGHSVANACRR